MRPRLKTVAWERLDGSLRLVHDVREQLLIDDPDGTVEALLGLLCQGGRTPDELATELAHRNRDVSVSEVSEAIDLLDDYRLIEDGDRVGQLLPAERERLFSNLAFFETFATMHLGRDDFQKRLREAHVLVLGTGGLNSNTIPHLCGLGVGRLTLLDRDAVEPRNFARQYLYRWTDIGARKVTRAKQWVQDFDPRMIKVDAVDAGIDGPGGLGQLLDRCRPDIVMSGVDHPAEIDSWVNAACVPRHVPYIRGGMWVTQGTVWSVDPHTSACHECARVDPAAETDLDGELAAARLYASHEQINRTIGPAAGLLGALAAFEVLRYLTRFEPPAYAGRPLLIDFAAGCSVQQPSSWTRRPTCAHCGTGDRTNPVGSAQIDRTRGQEVT